MIDLSLGWSLPVVRGDLGASSVPGSTVTTMGEIGASCNLCSLPDSVLVTFTESGSRFPMRSGQQPVSY